MKRNKTLGIIFLVIFGLSVLGGIANGTYADLPGKNIGYYIGFFGTSALILWIGIYNVMPEKGSWARAEEEYLKKQQLKKNEEERAAAEAKAKDASTAEEGQK